jgi:hypothetical protein
MVLWDIVLTGILSLVGRVTLLVCIVASHSRSFSERLESKLWMLQLARDSPKVMPSSIIEEI